MVCHKEPNAEHATDYCLTESYLLNILYSLRPYYSGGGGGGGLVQMMSGWWRGGAFVKHEAGGQVWAESETEPPWLGSRLQEVEGVLWGHRASCRGNLEVGSGE